MLAKVRSGSLEYSVDKALRVSADEADEQFLKALTESVRRSMADYSPAHGHPLAYAASALASLVGGTVTHLEMEDQPEGVVY